MGGKSTIHCLLSHRPGGLHADFPTRAMSAFGTGTLAKNDHNGRSNSRRSSSKILQRSMARQMQRIAEPICLIGQIRAWHILIVDVRALNGNKFCAYKFG
jgi:hypothetical protein